MDRQLALALLISSLATGLPLAQRTQTFFSQPLALRPAGIGFVEHTPLEFPPGRIAISSVTSDFVDEHGQSVPLDRAYMHHWFVHALDNNNTVVAAFGAGSEFRRVPETFDAPYAMLMEGTERWSAQLHAIDLRTLNDEDRLPCVECRRRVDCRDGSCLSPAVEPDLGNYTGGVYACNWDEANSTAGSALCAAPKPGEAVASYRLKYTVTYSSLDGPQARPWTKMYSTTLKAEAPYAEYEVPTCAADGSNPMCTHVQQSQWIWSNGKIKCTSCPVFNPRVAPGNPYDLEHAFPATKLGLIWATGHQHDGAQGLELWVKQPGGNESMVFESLPAYGSQPGVPGNELGFVVGFSIGRWSEPLEIKEGATLRVVSKYEAHAPVFNTDGFHAGPEVARTGVMGYMRLRFVMLD